jgi:hypothetical protein
MAETLPTSLAGVLPRRSLALATACLACAAVLPTVTFLPHTTVVALALVMAVVAVLHVTYRRTTGTLDYFEVLLPFTVLHFLSYPVGAYYLLENPEYLQYQSHYDYLVPAVGLAVLAYVAIAVGYHLSFPRLRPSSLIRVRMVGIKPMFFLAFLGFLGQSAAILVSRSLAAQKGVSGVLSALQQLSPLFMAAWFLAWYIAWQGDRHWTRRFLAPLVLVPQIIYAIYGTMGGKAFTITLCGLPAIAYWYVRGRLPVRWLVTVLLLAVFVVFPLYNSFRYQDRQLDTGRRLEKTMAEAQTWNRKEYFQRSVEAFVVRLAIVTSPAAVVRAVPRWVEYENGRTLRLGVLSFIPRVLWPGKPILQTGHEFGRTFGLLNLVDNETLVACTLVGEMYWNFGVVGVALWALLVGCVFRWVYRRYGEGGEHDALRKSLYIALLIQLMGYDGQQAIVLAALVKTVVLYYGAMWALESIGWIYRVPESASAG